MANARTIDLHELQHQALLEDAQEERRAPQQQRTRGRGAPPQRGPPLTQWPDTPGPRRPATAVMPLGPATLTRGPTTRNEGAGTPIDIHEILKAGVFAGDSAAADNHFEKSRPAPSAPWGVSDQYLVLDSWNAIRGDGSEMARGRIKWNFAIQGNTGDQVVGVHDRLDNIIEIQIGTFTCPIPPEVPYVLAAAPAVSPSGMNQLVLKHNNNNNANALNPLLLTAQYPATIPANTPWINNPYTQITSGNRITIQLAEIGDQAFKDANGARHHFECGVLYPVNLADGNPNMLTVFPVHGWDRFVFTEPIQDIAGLTLVFRNPDAPIMFLPDVLEMVSVSVDAAAAPGPYLLFTYAGHGLLVGDRIFVSGSNTGIATLDAYLNRAVGHVVSGDPTLTALAPSAPTPSPNTFWTDPAISVVDMLAAVTPKLPQLVTVRVAKRRIRIPVRFRRVVDRLTNYLQP